MSGSVIVAGARTPIGRLLGGLKDLSAADLGGVAIKGALEKAGVSRRPGRLRDHGPGHPGRRRPDHRPPGRGQGRHPDERPVDHHQQGVPVRPQRDRAGRPADPRRRVRDRRRRRHGVDDQRPAPAAQVPRGLQVRRHRRWSTRWPTTRSTTSSPTQAMGSLDRGCNAAGDDLTREEQDAFVGPVAPARGRGLEERRLRRRGRPGRRSRSARATRSSSPTDEGVRGDTTAESPRQAAPGLRQGRHHHRRLRLADLRRRLPPSS